MWLPRNVAETMVGGVHYTAQRGRDTNAISLFVAIVGGNYVPRRNASQIAFRGISGLRAGSGEVQVDPLGSLLHTNLGVVRCIKIVTVGNFISVLFCERCRDNTTCQLKPKSFSQLCADRSANTGISPSAPCLVPSPNTDYNSADYFLLRKTVYFSSVPAPPIPL